MSLPRQDGHGVTSQGLNLAGQEHGEMCLGNAGTA